MDFAVLGADLVLVALVIAFFALSIGYAALCDRL
jgi:hypothetical protein